MNLNENDGRAVDILLNGMPQGLAAMDAADGKGAPGTSRGAGPGFGSTRATSAMSDDLANRVTRVDQMLRLLDYLPVDEPSEGLVQKTLQRVQEARLRDLPAEMRVRAGATAQAGAAGINAGLHRSPEPADEDPANP